MKKPYIICYMMMSIDGRIDCAMTEKLPGEEYYKILDSFNAKTFLYGRVTAELEMSLPGKFTSKINLPLNKEEFYKAISNDGYEIIVDTNGTLLWEDQINKEKPLLIITSEKVNQEYLSYLKEKHISWIACGENKIDLTRACEILKEEFNVDRIVVLGGGHINGGFLEANLLDEINILIGAGIDGREGMCSVFDGLPINSEVKELKLKKVESFSSGAVWIRYSVK
jgi:2,5-diamino-6-(ribosylamino)-4(3H)-pyrimidinone 5'-phosphate reductase